MNIIIYTDSSKTEIENRVVAEAAIAEQLWPGRWEAEPEAASPDAAPDPCAALIDIGPFFDRFGAKKLAVLASADATVQAVLKDVQIRKWIDLTRADVAQTLDLFISKGLINAGDKAVVLATPVADHENLALRRSYFS